MSYSKRLLDATFDGEEEEFYEYVEERRLPDTRRSADRSTHGGEREEDRGGGDFSDR
jgi:hypothetical protein